MLRIRTVLALVAAALVAVVATVPARTSDEGVVTATAAHPPSPWVDRGSGDLAELTTTTTAPPTTTTTQPPPPTTTTTEAPPPPPPPSPPPTAAAAPAPRAGNCAGWEGTIAAHFPADQVAKACSVMMCETGGTGDPTIHNPSSTASGLWQFLDSTWRSTTGTAPPAANYSGDTQTAAAAKLWRSSGWSPWACA